MEKGGTPSPLPDSPLPKTEFFLLITAFLAKTLHCFRASFQLKKMEMGVPLNGRLGPEELMEKS